MEETLNELKNIIKEKDAIFGSERTIKKLKKGLISRIYLSKNYPQEKKEMIKELAKHSKAKVEIVELEKTKEEMHEVLKKPFSSSVISFVK